MCSWFSRASKRRIRGFGCVCVWIGREGFSRDGPWLGNEEPSDGKVGGWGGERTHKVLLLRKGNTVTGPVPGLGSSGGREARRSAAATARMAGVPGSWEWLQSLQRPQEGQRDQPRTRKAEGPAEEGMKLIGGPSLLWGSLLLTTRHMQRMIVSLETVEVIDRSIRSTQSASGLFLEKPHLQPTSAMAYGLLSLYICSGAMVGSSFSKCHGDFPDQMK